MKHLFCIVVGVALCGGVALADELSPDSGTPGHWAFEPLQKTLPPADRSGWSHRAVDTFIRLELHEHGLAPAPPTSRALFLRRITYDLTGLPPSPDAIDRFVEDADRLAYERLVDRLLANPHYGERWGRYWMDVVRYADTAGDNADYPVPELHRYRDYIIDAFNHDKPYDEFVREQLAGDILARQSSGKKYAEQTIATGFLALSRRYATAPYELMHLTLEDAIDTTGRAFLGLSLRCARCHDHKYDPISMNDYYGLYAIFAGTKYPYAGSEEFHSMRIDRQGFPALMTQDQAAPHYAAHARRVESLEAALKSARQQQDKPKEEIEKLERELARLKRPGRPEAVEVAYAVSDGPPVVTRIHRAGDPQDLGEEVERRVPRQLQGSAAVEFPSDSSGRLQLAQWITRPDNSLTARVMVNRVWQHHFGRGIVATPSDFGLRGEPPTHPELLDWLARSFIRGGYSIKWVHREILLSAMYRMSSFPEETSGQIDPENRLLSRFPILRLDAEATRDAMLSVSGRIDLSRPGPHPFPPITQWNWTQHHPFKAVYPSSHRSVYLMTQRLQRHPYLALFDGPDTNTTTAERAESTVPLQALFLMNSPFVREQAGAFAGRILREVPEDDAARIGLAYRLAYGRPPCGDEVEKALGFVARYQARLAATEEEEFTGRNREAWLAYCRMMLSSNEFVYID